MDRADSIDQARRNGAVGRDSGRSRRPHPSRGFQHFDRPSPRHVEGLEQLADSFTRKFSEARNASVIQTACYLVSGWPSQHCSRLISLAAALVMGLSMGSTHADLGKRLSVNTLMGLAAPSNPHASGHYLAYPVSAGAAGRPGGCCHVRGGASCFRRFCEIRWPSPIFWAFPEALPSGPSSGSSSGFPGFPE